MGRHSDVARMIPQGGPGPGCGWKVEIRLPKQREDEDPRGRKLRWWELKKQVSQGYEEDSQGWTVQGSEHRVPRPREG